MTEVNLASKLVNRIRKRQRFKRWTRNGFIWGSLSLVLILILITGYSLLVHRTNEKLQTRIDLNETQIESLSKVEGQQLYLTSKLDAFEKLIETHELHQLITETVFEVLPAGTTLNGFNVEESGVIALNGQVQNWHSLIKFMSNLNETGEDRLPIVAAKMRSLSFGEDMGVRFDLELTLKVPGES